jgi:hypothetical protein
MRKERIDDSGEQDRSDADLAIVLGAIAGGLICAFVVYGITRLGDLLAWIGA